MRPIHTDLPAPTAGMLLAKSPTGVIMAFVVLVLALFASMFTLAEGSLVTTVVYLVGIAIAWRVFQKKRAAATAEGAVSRTA